MDPRSNDPTGPALPEEPSRAAQARAARGGYAVEIRTAAEMESEIEAWRELGRRAVEANVFAEPEITLAAMQHRPEGRNVVLLLVWEGGRSTAAGGILRAVFPCLMPRLTVARQIVVWNAAPDCSGVPLVDRAAPADTIEAALAYLASKHARFAGLSFSHVPTDGTFAAALRSVAARTKRAIEPSATWRRHVLIKAPGMDDLGEGSRRRIVDDLREGRQKLSELGEVEIDRARSGRFVRDAVEEFLLLDALGAAKDRRPALVQGTGMASFIRIATRQLAQLARCRVDVLRVGGRAVAAAIIIESETQAWLWKIASDPSFAHLSADTQVILDVTRTQLDRPGLVRTEACRGCDNRIISELWQERMAADYLVALRPQSSPATLAVRIGQGLRRLRAPVRIPRP
jgi:CelD/BcsL family acetyltransferase involved in cellulose biosynthesis